MSPDLIRPFILASIISLMGLSAGGCAQDINPDGGGPESTPGEVTTVENDDGTFTVTVNATADEDWIYIDLEAAPDLKVFPETPEDSTEWDIAFQRFKLMTNGGVSGTGGVRGIRMAEQSFAALAQAPASGYGVDSEDSPDEDTIVDTVFLGPLPWFDYDGGTHILSPADAIYVVQSVEGNYFKVRILDYYDEAGTSGFPKIQFGEVDAPDPADIPELEGLQIDLTEADTWHYVVLATTTLVSVDDPMATTTWDLAFNAEGGIKTNGGASGMGLGGAQESASSDWESVTTSPTVGFVRDDGEGNSVLVDWASEDGETPRDVVYLIRGAEGAYGKLRVMGMMDETLVIQSKLVEREVETHTTTLDTSDGDVFFDFDAGALVSMDDPSTSDAWDFGIIGGLLQTNSGTSGPGEGGAEARDEAALEDLISPADGHGCYLLTGGHKCDCELTFNECAEIGEIWTKQCGNASVPCASNITVDEETEVDGEPGSANPVLMTWHEGDATDSVAIIRTRSGDYVKLQVIEHDEGALTIDWAYSGRGQSVF